MTAQATQSMDEFDIPEDYREETLPATTRPTAMNASWQPSLVYDLALGIDTLENICVRNQTSEDEVHALFENRIFSLEVANLRNELQNEGVTISRKAKTQFESYLVDLHTMIKDIDTPAATKHAMIRTVGDVGNVWPKKGKDDEKDATAACNIQININ